MDVDSLVGTVFSGLSALVVQDVADGGGMVVVTARTRDAAVPCPVCGTATAQVHGYHHRTLKDVPVDRAANLPHLHSFTNGLEIDRSAVDAALTLPYHNGRTEGVNTRTKRIMRQMHGRAGFDLLRHRILLP
jgi:transposase